MDQFIEFDKRPVKVEISESTKKVLEAELGINISETLNESENNQTIIEAVKKSKKVVSKKKKTEEGGTVYTVKQVLTD
jgi:hypothetical protein